MGAYALWRFEPTGLSPVEREYDTTLAGLVNSLSASVQLKDQRSRSKVI